MQTASDIFREIVESDLARSAPDHGRHVEFALGRTREGRAALEYLQEHYAGTFASSPWILDLGGGNGGFLVPFLEQGYRCCRVDRTVPRELLRLRRLCNVRAEALMADAAAVPIKSESVDLLLYVETIEHVDATAIGREISRILRPGGLCYITSPPRLRFLFRRDPHYGIPGLLLLPDALQRMLFRLLKPEEEYEVEHIFWSVRGIVKTIPRTRLVEITSKNWSGPLRRLDWDWIVVEKV